MAIIEDARRIRDGLTTLINATGGYRCALSFRSMEDALARPWSEAPDVALVDIGLPGMSGIEGLARLRERYPKVALLLLSVYEDDERIFQALCAGAGGYLLKKTPPEKVDYDLTPHELRLLRLLVGGHNYQSAAAELGVSFSTINFHMQNIYGKLQVHSKSEAVAKALRQRLVK